MSDGLIIDITERPKPPKTPWHVWAPILISILAFLVSVGSAYVQWQQENDNRKLAQQALILSNAPFVEISDAKLDALEQIEFYMKNIGHTTALSVINHWTAIVGKRDLTNRQNPLLFIKVGDAPGYMETRSVPIGVGAKFQTFVSHFATARLHEMIPGKWDIVRM